MPAEVRIVDQEFLFLSADGDNFDLNTNRQKVSHLKANVGEKVRAIFNVQVNWYDSFEGGSLFYYVKNTVDVDIITINSLDASFIQNGFSVGDTVKFSDNNWRYDFEVTALTQTEMVGNIIGTPTGDITAPDEWHDTGQKTYITGVTKKTALKFYYGLIENNENPNYLSKVTNSDQIYFVDSIQHPAIPTDPWTPVFSDGVSFGTNKAWQSGELSCAFVRYVPDKDLVNTENTTQEFQIIHDFIVNPMFREGEEDSLSGEDNPPLDLFNGDRSLKYVFKAEFRTNVNDPNTSLVTEYDTQAGSVGYYNENYNGFVTPFEANIVSMTVDGDNVSKVDAGNVTTVTATISKTTLNNFTDFTPVVIGHTSLLNADQYTKSTLDYNSLWNNDLVRIFSNQNFGESNSKDGTVIRNAFIVGVSPNVITVQFDVDLSYGVTDVEEGQEYLLTLTTEDAVNVNPSLSGKTNLILDYNTYTKNSDISGLWYLNSNKFEIYPHAEPLTIDGSENRGFTNAKGFIEDGLFLQSAFIKSNDQGCLLTALSFEFNIFNNVTNEVDTLRSYDFDLSSSFVSNGAQYINLDSERGYFLKSDDYFNSVKISTPIANSIQSQLDIEIGFKTPWQDWLEFKKAPSDFFNQNQSFNGRNQKSSNYSGNIADYELRVMLRADLEQNGITTQYLTSSEEIKVYDYDEYDTTEQDVVLFECDLNTYRKNGVKLDGNIIEKDFTEVKAIFIPDSEPNFTEFVDMTEVASQWGRFAHGNKVQTSDKGQIRLNGKFESEGGSGRNIVDGSWANDQAGTLNGIEDTFNNGAADSINRSKTDVTYNSDTSSITTTDNMAALYGCYSPYELEYYELRGKMFSDNSDNDGLCYNIAFFIDDEGVESTLSLCASTGGIYLGLNPFYDPNSGITNNQTSSTFLFNYSTDNNNRPTYALVYNWGKRDCQILDIVNSSAPTGLGWGSSSVGDLNFYVVRSADQLTVTVEDWTISGQNIGNASTPFTYNLNDNDFTEKFKGLCSIGFSFNSQSIGGFKDVELTRPDSDYYGIIRIEPENSGSDFGIYEISSLKDDDDKALRPYPDGNLLINPSDLSSERFALLQWDGTQFVIQAKIDTDQITQGQKYKLSAEIRSKDLTEI
jgi:hypothetical protein